MAGTDQFAHLFELQRELNLRIGVDTTNMTDQQRQEWILNYCRAMNQEIAELTDCVPWKWWAKYQKFDQQNARVEIVDMLHFLISLCQVVGMDADEVFNAYTKKHQVNITRQDSGYVTKNEDDSKHI